MTPLVPAAVPASFASALSPDHPWLVAAAIIAGTFIHEDLTTVATGVMVAGGAARMGVALPALYVGIVLGDMGLYGLGRLIALNKFSQALVSREKMVAFKVWLDQRLMLGVFIVRFLPGLRLTAYTTYGFFAMPFGRFVVSVLLAASIWTTGLFYLSYLFGALTEQWLGWWRWPAILLAFLLPLYAVQKLVRAKTPEAGGGA